MGYPNMVLVRRYQGTLMFLGTRYQGWQTQKKGQSIQEEVEKVLSTILNQPIRAYGASRTDAKVHARGFVFHFDASTHLAVADILRGFNRLIPQDIFLKGLRMRPLTFHTRFSPSIKHYQFSLLLNKNNPFLAQTTQRFHGPFSLAKAQAAWSLFAGKHCFKNFTVKKEDEQNFVREIHHTSIKQRGDLVILSIQGDGFMTHMVRMLVGTVLAHVQGKLTLEDIKHLLKTNKHLPVSYKAEPHGLCLESVKYVQTA